MSQNPRTSSANGNNPKSNPNYNARRPSHPALDAFRRHSSLHYQAFPFLRPPKNSGQPLSPPVRSPDISDPLSRANIQGSNASSNDNINRKSNSTRKKSSYKRKKMASPIPKRQLFILAVIALCEQTAFNSISPYLPEMVGLFPGVEREDVGVSVGMIASAFAVAQFVSEY